MVLTRNIKATMLSSVVLMSLVGCGDGTPQAPKGAVRPPDPAPVETNTKPKDQWTTQDKIDAIQKSGMAPEQKKAMIAQLSGSK